MWDYWMGSSSIARGVWSVECRVYSRPTAFPVIFLHPLVCLPQIQVSFSSSIKSPHTENLIIPNGLKNQARDLH